nr:YdeI/OmpD-associated family protein [Frankia tisae]
MSTRRQSFEVTVACFEQTPGRCTCYSAVSCARVVVREQLAARGHPCPETTPGSATSGLCTLVTMGVGGEAAGTRVRTAAVPELLIVADGVAWRAWLDVNEDVSDGVWLVLAKKGTTSPTSLRYDFALEEALCSGWIDGQKKSLDAATFQQRFTPRRKASLWSERNTVLVARLIEEGRMRPRGQAEIERAKLDGRWDRAYPGAAKAQVPDDLVAALAASPTAGSAFAALNGADRYSVLHRLLTASNPATRATRLTALLAILENGGPASPR